MHRLVDSKLVPVMLGSSGPLMDAWAVDLLPDERSHAGHNIEFGLFQAPRYAFKFSQTMMAGAF